MTTDLRERLDDLLAVVPDHVVPADPAVSWRAGARRRVRRRVTVGAAAVAVVTLLAGTGLAGARVLEAQPADNGAGASKEAATSYPSRIDAPLRQGDLPSHPGPIAGVIERPDGWYAVSPTGQVWRISGSNPEYLATVSPDGSRLAYLNTLDGNHEWGVEDLRTGEWRTNDVGAAGSNSAFTLAPHTQTFWSPDSQRLLVPVTPGDIRPPLHHVTAVVLHGLTLTTVTPPPGRHVVPVGWLSDRRLGWLRWHGSDFKPDLLLTSATGGRVLQSGPSPVSIPRDLVSATAWFPTGSRRAMGLLVTTMDRDFYLSSLGQRGDPAILGSRDPHLTSPCRCWPTSHDRIPDCPVSWGVSQPWIAVKRTGDGAVLTARRSGHALIQADPRLHIRCSVWATSALDGSAHRGVGQWLFGSSDSWLSWHWREVAIGVSGGLMLLGLPLVLAVRRRLRWARAVETKS